ncbi:MAG: SIMPL domain-containing protein [Muribaculaceae bacterium]
MKSTNLVGALLLAVGLLALGLCIRSGLNSFSTRDRVVAVRGLSEREVKANKVTWPVVYKEVGNQLPAIYDRINATNATIINFLTSNGITKEEISVNAPDIVDLQADRYNNQQALPFRYNVTSVITVTSANVDKVRELINRQAELLKDGIAITAGDYNYRTIYEYTDLNTIKPDMIADATKNAREAAKKFADDSDSKIGKIKDAQQGQFSIDDRDPYTPYIKKVRVVTYLNYYLED